MDSFARTRAAADAFLNEDRRKPLVMGILNVTPDSFSDGGSFVPAANRAGPCLARWRRRAPT